MLLKDILLNILKCHLREGNPQELLAVSWHLNPSANGSRQEALEFGNLVEM